MTFDDINPTLKDWLFAMEVVRRLGFGANDIFFVVQAAGAGIIENGIPFEHDQPAILLRILKQGREFIWTIGTIDMPEDKIQAAFEEACEIWIKMPNTDARDRAFKASRPFSDKIGLMIALKAKGFEIPVTR